MATYKLYATEIVERLNGSDRQVIMFKITADNARFPLNSQDYSVTVLGDSEYISSFSSHLSKNGEVVIAYFTSDAFTSITSNQVTVVLLLGVSTFHVFENFDLSTDIASLNALFASLGAPQGDNAWLSTLI
jgi:hypothetical protein